MSVEKNFLFDMRVYLLIRKEKAINVKFQFNVSTAIFPKLLFFYCDLRISKIITIFFDGKASGFLIHYQNPKAEK